ncbi:MAG: biotin/lipoyl-containing protein, partial [Chloroflexota bacterium]
MPAEIRVPALGESVVEATVGKWLKNVGDAVTTGDPLVSLETDKVDMEVAAEQAGVLARIDKAAGDTVAVGEVLGSLSGADAVPTENGSKPPAVSASTPTQAPPQPVTAPTQTQTQPVAGAPQVTPVARRLAGEEGIDLAGLQGSGPGGRITKLDVAGARTGSAPTATPAIPTAAPALAAPPPVVPTPEPKEYPASAPRDGREQRIRMSRRRQTIARRLLEAQHNAAMLTTFNEVDMTA